ncbi:hypothetical protein [Streptomyces lincolnensis]|uniref:hypothetical protein n=1 Tax=Streptomyces lincolnensis TaxID=1915 RepID=UPI0037D4E345
MSAVAVEAAAVPEALRAGARRPALRAVPMEAGPVVALELGNPLQLTETMRARLLAAVRALVSDPALKGAGDPARLAAVVLLAKARVAADYSTEITAAELGRWVGLKKSRIAHKVLPELRERGVVGSNETTSAAGRMTGLECWVIPMYRAQQSGDRRHVLALSRVELAVLLALIEVLFAPGWTHRDGRVTPAGLLADRTGRGAATDRLGLLLMVLSTNSRGWLQLCPGSVDTERGRPAATVGRLLGCSPAGGAKVLKRLEERDTLTVDRRDTASGLNERSRVRLLPVARAHGLLVQEAHVTADAVFSDLAGTASGDHETAGDAVTPMVTGIEGAGQGPEAATADLAVAAHLHASHPPVVTSGGSLSLSGGFSGEGRGGNGGRPERACVREDQSPDAAAAGQLRLVDGEGGPLRGEKPQDSESMSSKNAGCGPVTGTPVRVVDGSGRRQQGRELAALADLRLRTALAPVAWLWAQLSRGQQAVAVRAAGHALDVLAGISCPEAAPRLLAARLSDRLEEAGGEALVREPMGWLLGRGLVQRQACSDRRCDDGIRLDAGTDCESCANVIHLRRHARRRAAAEVDAVMPGADPALRRAGIEARLREHFEEARTGVARAEAEVAQRRAAVARRRAVEEAAEQERRSAPCVECGMPEAAGLCPPCTYRRRTDVLVGEAVDLAVAVRADLADPAQVAALTQACEADTRALVAKVSQRSAGGEGALGAFTASQVAERVRDERRASAYRRMLSSEEAEVEAQAVFDSALRRRPSGRQAAQAAADEARRRAAHHLLEGRLGQLRVLRLRAAAVRVSPRAG